ncbi:MAG TPA: sugar porter family MFS transporter, partial [Chthoniobacteraceae bacterium]|nr:sugar porter family MFS transporter [Chthoniobacteraceae bacterium]
VSSVAAIGGFLFGYDSACINGTVDALKLAFHANNVGSGFNVASMLLGCAVGAFFAGGIADKFGRRAALFASAVLFAIGAYGAGASTSSMMFVVFRLIGGVAVGAASVIAPAYISEVAPAAYRGRLSSLQQLGIVTGIFFALLINYFIAKAAVGHTASGEFWMGYQAWKWMFWVQLVPIALFFLGLFTIPESPRYLVAAGKADLAQAVLAKTSHPKDADAKVAEIKATLAADHRPSLKDLFDRSSGKVHPVVWVGLIIAALQQFVGINVIFYYGEVLWKAAGSSEADALIHNVILGTINVGSTLVAIALVDKWGRKPLLIMGSVGMVITLGLMAYIFGTAKHGADGNLDLGNLGMPALVAACAYVFAFGVSWGPIVWVLLGEMFPNQMRGAALAVSGLSQWLANFAITMTFPILLDKFGLGGAYGLYAAFALISIFIVMAIVKETKGRTLEQMTS